MKKLRDCTPIKILRIIYLGLCQLVLQYGISIWGGAGKSSFMEIERAQRAVLKVMLKKPFRFPTDELYETFPVLRVRQLFILSATLHAHKSVKNRPDYQTLLSKRNFHVPLPNANSLLARRCPYYSHILIYNNINKSCNIKGLSTQSCKLTTKKLLLSLTYSETEEIINSKHLSAYNTSTL
ncbi:hypothetical protein PYW07_011229 [Mythimna separata]|uniref:Uncharacterized protein n=1 Tax=Mythimna separata TaxID=271217 RepID=A0AAD8DKA4_MYTSE|nr:hypothetical protein PYW07_011229 [Mythimna separata]